MKKAIKLFSLLMALLLTMSLFTGCTESNLDTDEEDLSTLNITIAVPADKNSPNWDDWKDLMASWVEDFETFSHIKLKIETIPTDEKGLKQFKKKVKSGKISCFLGTSNETINQLLADEALMELSVIEEQYTALMEKIPQGVRYLSLEDDSTQWMVPIYGTYQAVYCNTEIFEQHQLSLPTTWEELTNAINVLKAAGVTPISAGFADKGLGYMIDELILSEGGTAEHSYQPTFGTVSSWERAASEMKDLELAGAFTPDCYNVTFEQAVADFEDGKAAMIVAPSSEMIGHIDEDNVAVIGLPATAGGKREAGAFVGDVEHGIYISRNGYQKKNTRYGVAIVELLGSDYFGSPEFYNLVKSEATFCANPDNYSGEEENNFEESVVELTDSAVAADIPMSQSLKTFDNLTDTFRAILKDGMTVKENEAEMKAKLLVAAEAEIEANTAPAEKE